MTYYRRHIDEQLLRWKESENRKPLLVRGARQVGKSSAARELGKLFRYFVEVNLEKSPALARLFTADIDVHALCSQLSAAAEIPIVAGETLLFIDEIQISREAIMYLRYFREDYPELHVIAAGSLLEFTLGELSSFAVGRVRSLYMYPLGAEEDGHYRKYLFLDVGLMLTMLSVSAGDVLLRADDDLVNKGAVSEVFVGLEMLKYHDCFTRAELYYWQNNTRNGNAEVDYLTVSGGRVIPVEVKASTKGSMQSLYLFMRKKHLPSAVRLSMENFSRFTYTDHEDGDSVRVVDVVPLYSVSSLFK